jgi:hypothetical protein
MSSSDTVDRLPVIILIRHAEKLDWLYGGAPDKTA